MLQAFLDYITHTTARYMEVDYLLFHEDREKVENMLQALTRRRDGLFRPNWRRAQGLSIDSWKHISWGDVTVREIKGIKGLGTNVIQYNVTLSSIYAYPEFVAAVLIENGWRVNVRYSNADRRSMDLHEK
jgi:hypothetical protein